MKISLDIHGEEREFDVSVTEEGGFVIHGLDSNMLAPVLALRRPFSFHRERFSRDWFHDPYV